MCCGSESDRKAKNEVCPDSQYGRFKSGISWDTGTGIMVSGNSKVWKQAACNRAGVVFDRAGNRIGYGGGYYDSYLKQADCIKVGVAFDFQCVEQIVPEVHDVPVDYIITEKEMITCRQACQEIR